MKIVIQRVRRASVRVRNEFIAEIGPGMLVLVGVRLNEDIATARRLAEKTAALRIFANEEGRLDLSVLDTGGEALVVSQFTLYADSRRGNRPSFSNAATPDIAAPLVESYASVLEELGVRVSRGRFGAMMDVELVNDGPVTIVIESGDLARARNERRGAETELAAPAVPEVGAAEEEPLASLPGEAPPPAEAPSDPP